MELLKTEVGTIVIKANLYMYGENEKDQTFQENYLAMKRIFLEKMQN